MFFSIALQEKVGLKTLRFQFYVKGIESLPQAQKFIILISLQPDSVNPLIFQT